MAQEVDLASDAQLQAKLTVQQPLIPLSELLRQIQRETGTPLYADRAIADDKVCVLAYDKPAHEILTRLAETLRYRWTRSEDGKGYRLLQPAVERARENALQRAYTQARLEHVRRPLSEILNLVSRYTDQQLRNLPKSERARLSLEAQSFLAESETSYTVARLLLQVPDGLWARFWEGQPIVFSSNPQTGQLPLPPAAAQRLGQEAASQFQTRMPESLQGANGEIAVKVYYNRDRDNIEVDIIYKAQQGTSGFSGSFNCQLWMSPDWSSESLHNHAENRVWRDWATPAKSLPDFSLSAQPKLPPIPESIRNSPLAALIRYTRTHKLDLYADAYRLRRASYSSPQEDSGWQTQDLANIFWLRRGGDALMARHREYYLLRPSEIPERMLTPLEEKLKREQEITLDEWASFADALTPAQIARANGEIRIGWGTVVHATTVPVGMLVEVLPALRFWNTLNPQQRRTALEGKPLSPSQFTARQRERFFEAVRYTPPRLLTRIPVRGLIFTDAGTQLYSYSSTSLSIGQVVLGEGRQQPPQFRLEKGTVRPARRYTFQDDQVVVQPPEKDEPTPTLRLVFIGEEAERVYTVPQKPPR